MEYLIAEADNLVSSGVEIHRWTRKEYERLAARRFLKPEIRVELIDGIIYDQPRQSSLHATGCGLTWKALRTPFPPSGYEIRPRFPILLNEDSEPEPDAAVVPGSFLDYAHAHPSTALLIVEVADRTLLYDRTKKIPLYARSGIQETWLLNLNESSLEVHRNPVDGVYRTHLVLQAGDTVAPVARPDVPLAVATLLP